MVTGSLQLLLVESVSPPPETVAEQFCGVAAFRATSTVIAIHGYEVRFGRTSLRVHVSVGRSQVQPVLASLMAVALSPGSSVATTVTSEPSVEAPVMLELS